jgi:homopolymeric O-antigen transport system permease protein
MQFEAGSLEAGLEVVVIKPRGVWSALDLPLLWRFRDLLLAFAGRDIRLRYRQTFLGVAWVILQPLLGAGIFTFVFGIVAKMPSGGAPFFVLSYAGLLGWTFFSGGLTRISTSLVANAALIRKIFFPRLILPLAVIPCILLDFGVGSVVMAGLMLAYGIHVQTGLLLVPLCLAILAALALGIGMVATSLAVKYRDIQYIVPLFMQLLMYASPVGYSASAVPDYLRSWYYLNPVAAPIEVLRWAILGSGTPPFGYLGYAGMVGLICLAMGTLVFKRLEREFADVI